MRTTTTMMRAELQQQQQHPNESPQNTLCSPRAEAAEGPSQTKPKPKDTSPKQRSSRRSCMHQLVDFELESESQSELELEFASLYPWPGLKSLAPV
ncbi:hypothetical protein AWZ03_005919 [Drosophila navojoa]|uniref:Uncharacterized protein n=1 Tax=Drosophila navojoa TaxID=7232 RepID=A0A484BIQ1_DRONA|nr:hypothetical protein AWZ03_005919 [Drosophila navojoa]